MIWFDILAQGIGISAMLLNVLSFHMKDRRGIIFLQLFGTLLFGINYAMLGATVGAVLNFFGAFRAIVYYFDEKFKAQSPVWLYVFCGAYILSYILTFAVFGKELTPMNLVVEALPVIAMILSTVSYRCREARLLRMYGIICSPLWLSYNIINFAVGAIICETVNIFSLALAIWRLDIKGGTSAGAPDSSLPDDKGEDDEYDGNVIG